jgi:hypothetical protein
MNSGKPNITDIAWALISKWAHTEAISKAKRCDLEVCELIGLGDLEGAYALRDSAAVNDYSIKKVIKKDPLGWQCRWPLSINRTVPSSSNLIWGTRYEERGIQAALRCRRVYHDSIPTCRI